MFLKRFRKGKSVSTKLPNDLISKKVMLKEVLGIVDPGIRPIIEEYVKVLPTISGKCEEETKTEREKKFRIVSEGNPFTTNIYYGDEKISCVKKVVVSADVKNPVLQAEVVLNLNGSNCDLEINYENMIISFGGQQFYLIPKPINNKTKQRIFDLIQKENEEGE